MYCKQVVVQTDHKTLESIRKKSIASLRLQPLLIRLSIYDEVRYIPEKANVFADSLSRESYIKKPAFNNRVSLIEVNTITGKLEGMGECTNKDMIHHGWPKYSSDYLLDLKKYSTFRQDSSVEKLRNVKLSFETNCVHRHRSSRSPGSEKCRLKSQRVSVFARYRKGCQKNDYHVQSYP